MAEKMHVEEIPVAKIDYNEEYTRFQAKMDDSYRRGIVELASSIKSVGLLQPIVIAKKNGRYVALAGNRRLQAVKELLKWDAIPANVVDAEPFFIAFTENMQRADLTDVERGFWLIKASKELESKYTSKKAMMDHFAKTLGKSPRVLYDYISLARDISPESIKAYEEGKISATDLIKQQREARKKKAKGKAKGSGKGKGKGAPGQPRQARKVKPETVVKQTEKRFISLAKDLLEKMQAVQKFHKEFENRPNFLKAFDLLKKQVGFLERTFSGVSRR